MDVFGRTATSARSDIMIHAKLRMIMPASQSSPGRRRRESSRFGVVVKTSVSILHFAHFCSL